MSRTTHLSPVTRGHTVTGASRRLRFGVALIAVSLAGIGALGPFNPARAQDVEAVPIEISKQAYWSRSLGHVAPNALTSTFPPTAVCLVAPQLCRPELGPVQSPINQQVVGNQPEDRIPGGDQIAKIMAGNNDNYLPTGVIAGNRRYLSAIQFDLPEVPSGHKVTKFELHLTPVDDPRLNYHFDSPAFRQAVVAALVGVGRREPEPFREETEKIGKEPHVPTSDQHLGVEACPIVAEWSAGANQDSKSAPERDSVERVTVDGESKSFPQQVNCALNASTKVVNGVWVFDLSFAANAWATERIANNGILLRPVVPPNLAYGDPDLSTWDQVTFHSAASTDKAEEKPRFVFETEEKARPVSFVSSRSDDVEVLGAQESTETFTETFGAIDDFATPADVVQAEEPAPVVRPAAPALLSGDAVTQWWTWLFVPMLLAGIYVTTQAMAAEPALAAVERSGAMTRLIEARRKGLL